MAWQKLGRVYGPDGSLNWAQHSALTPTPWLLDSETIRVFVGFRDQSGISRIGWVDVDSKDPLEVKQVSQTPVLDIGRPGAFDDNGVILGDIIAINDEIYMYYVGFQKAEKVKFLAFSGIAKSKDGGNTFSRISDAPVLDRCHDGLYIRAIHSIRREEDKYRIWYAIGNDWQVIKDGVYPRYHIQTMTSDNGIDFYGVGDECLTVTGNEYRIGRPRVYRTDNKYVMYFTAGSISGSYLPGYAESSDGVIWKRDDSKLGITLSTQGWDSRHLCYPALIKSSGKTYMFYNGNNMGFDGFGCATLLGEDL